MSEQGAGPPPNGLRGSAGASVIDRARLPGHPLSARLGVVDPQTPGRGRVPPSILFQESLPRRWDRGGGSQSRKIMTFARIDVSSHRRLEGPHQSSQYERSKPSVKLPETGIRVGEITLHVPSLSPRTAGLLARARPHQGDLPRRDTLGPAQRNGEEWGSSGPGTLKGEDSKDLPGSIFC